MAGPVPGTRTDAARNHERLLAAARAVYAARGVDASLKEVADEAGLGVGTVYRHFPTKEALQETVLIGHLRALRDRAEELARDPADDDAVLTWLAEFVVHFTEYRGLVRALMPAVHDTATPVGGACAGARVAGAALLERAQRAGVMRCDLTMDTLLVLVAGIATAQERAPEGSGPLLGWLIDGLRPPAPGRLGATR
jgi:AcrR family transcriptional regulator